jgi:hypothetical protein
LAFSFSGPGLNHVLEQIREQEATGERIASQLIVNLLVNRQFHLGVVAAENYDAWVAETMNRNNTKLQEDWNNMIRGGIFTIWPVIWRYLSYLNSANPPDSADPVILDEVGSELIESMSDSPNCDFNWKYSGDSTVVSSPLAFALEHCGYRMVTAIVRNGGEFLPGEGSRVMTAFVKRDPTYIDILQSVRNPLFDRPYAEANARLLCNDGSWLHRPARSARHLQKH